MVNIPPIVMLSPKGPTAPFIGMLFAGIGIIVSQGVLLMNAALTASAEDLTRDGIDVHAPTPRAANSALNASAPRRTR